MTSQNALFSILTANVDKFTIKTLQVDSRAKYTMKINKIKQACFIYQAEKEKKWKKIEHMK
nr:MAG TPA: hypothetical protein [Caudoviricetes sp.]